MRLSGTLFEGDGLRVPLASADDDESEDEDLGMGGGVAKGGVAGRNQKNYASL